jgi:uncharacterized protein (TIGR03437 family)
MRIVLRALLGAILPASLLLGQISNYPYIVRDYAGAFPLGDGGPAVNALLYYPAAAVPDNAGNVYILDSDNSRIRQVTPDGKISTLVTGLFGYDMKVGADGLLYVAGSGRVYRVTTTGQVTTIAGSGTFGHSGDNGPALQANFGALWGIALDAGGNIYLSETSSIGHYVREILLDGTVRTIAGTSSTTYNGENQPALSTNLYYPQGIAVDSNGVIYVADEDHSRVRKFTVGGAMTTVAGNGIFAKALDGPATVSPVASPEGIWLDRNNNLYIADWGYGVLVKVTAGGTLSTIVGVGTGPFPSLRNVSADSTGTLYVVDYVHQVTRINLALKAFPLAGRPHYAGDNGPAVTALLNQPTAVALDGHGSLYIYDQQNYLIRKVAPDGTITTVGGQTTYGYPKAGLTLSQSPLGNYINDMAVDASGALYLATNWQVFRVGADNILTVAAGTGATGNLGDNGKATAATFTNITGIALDATGNLYIADYGNARVRKVDANTNIITAFAGAGTRGFSGDGALATSAQLNPYFQMSLAVDAAGNVYIADGTNYRVRMVDPSGLISTVVGNGNFGRPSNASAKSAFSAPGKMGFDAQGLLYVASQNYSDIYAVSGGSIRLISGGGNSLPVDGTPALAGSFSASSIAVETSGDLYASDYFNNTVRHLVLNSPQSLSVVDGSNQTGSLGQPLPKLLRVQLNGRAGVGVGGVAVKFAVLSGTATLSATNTTTDNNGAAAVSLTLGSAPGPVIVTATVSGLPAVTFSEGTPGATCSVPPPVITSAASAGDFGGGSTFASGSWIEIKGHNLSLGTRQWAGGDFNGPAAPTNLDGVTVTINGRPAFVSYISPAQLNVQAPADSISGGVPLVVSVSGCAGAAITVQKAPSAPGLLAPGAFNIGGRQYLVATYPDGTFVGRPGLIPGASFRAAAPGDTITLYGIGFGDVTPPIDPGQVVSAANRLPNFTLSFGSTPAVVTFAGLAPGVVGLYQFNVTVPPLVSGDYAITAQAGSATAKAGYLTVSSNLGPVTPAGPNIGIAVTDVDPNTPIATDNIRVYFNIANTAQISGGISTYVYISSASPATLQNSSVLGPIALTLNGKDGPYYITGIPLPPSIQPGTYSVAIGAKVVGNTDPNAVTLSNSGSFQVLASRPPFDLAATIKSVTPQQAGSGDAITLVYNVTEAHNLSGTFTRSVYLGTRPNVTTSDTLLDTRSFDQLRTGGDVTSASINLPKNLAPGTYYVAVVVQTDGDTNPANNTTAGLPLTVLAQRLPFDLAVQVLGVNPAAVAAGGTFTVDYGITNKSNAAGSYTRSVYLSSDGKISTASQLLGTGSFSVAGGNGAFTTSSITMPATTQPGSYFIGVIIEGVGDTNPADNVSNAFPVTVNRGALLTAPAIEAVAGTEDRAARDTGAPAEQTRGSWGIWR